MRGTFANIRLRNLLAPGTEGGFTHAGRRAETIYDAAMAYAEEGTPLCVLAGKEYGSGSSRDWAAKGPRLLGVRFVIAESYERIHRSNLVGMGVLPLQFPDGESVESLGLTGEETFDLAPLEEGAQAARHGHAGRRRADRVRRPRAHRHAQRVAVLPRRRHPALRAARAAGERLTPRRCRYRRADARRRRRPRPLSRPLRRRRLPRRARAGRRCRPRCSRRSPPACPTERQPRRRVRHERGVRGGDGARARRAAPTSRAGTRTGSPSART